MPGDAVKLCRRFGVDVTVDSNKRRVGLGVGSVELDRLTQSGIGVTEPAFLCRANREVVEVSRVLANPRQLLVQGNRRDYSLPGFVKTASPNPYCQSSASLPSVVTM